ncbi:MAG: CRISPR-associated protein Csm7 [Magnetococcales bacterium]|nr:CRISPR-associated protein Csm7 [Magnetococcales bacterium]
MKTMLATILPQTAFATPPHGDTLFGQLCWSLRNRYGDDWLAERLQGYVGQNAPFLVVSDWFPAGYWPRPFLPPVRTKPSSVDRKAEKKKIWLPRDKVHLDLKAWLSLCQSEEEIWKSDRKIAPQPHNSINRLTGTTGKEGFAPFQVDQTWFPPDARLEIWLVVDPDRLDEAELRTALEDVGRSGFGKDASTGIGKFVVEKLEPAELPNQKNSTAWLTLGFCAPQGCGLDPERSCYSVLTRFGRHGDVAAIQGRPFKQPVLLARAGAVLVPSSSFVEMSCVGQGISKISKMMPETVTQGYAPVVGLCVDREFYDG